MAKQRDTLEVALTALDLAVIYGEDGALATALERAREGVRILEVVLARDAERLEVRNG